MITLEASSTLAADADVGAGSNMVYTLFGMELTDGGSEGYKRLAQGTMATSATTIYTVASATTTFIKTITVVNNDLTASHTAQFFAGGTAAGNAISAALVIPAGGMAIYEDNLGWSITTIAAGTTLLNDVHTGYQDWAGIAEPSVPGAGTLRLFAHAVSGRMLLKWVGPAGLDNHAQPALFGNNMIMFTPYGSTTVTPNGFGTTWAKGGSAGTVSSPTCASTAPAIINQMRRVRHANAATTTNQCMGIISTAAGMSQFWRGNSAGLGGFFFFARFAIALTASTSERLFVGLTPGTAEVVASDTVANNSCGLWHDTTDGNNLYFMTRDGTTTHKGSAIPSTNFAAGQGYDFYMFARPNDSVIYYRLDDINAGTTLIDSSESNNLPTNTVFLGPQVEISNGTTDVTVTTVAIDINRIYVESDH